MGIEGKVAVIAGASGGLGKMVTQSLAEEGARLVLLGRSQDSLEALVDDLGLAEENILLSTADLSQPGALEGTTKEVKDKFGRVDILINLVGGWTGGDTLVEAAPDAIENMLQQHLWTTVHLVKAFVPAIMDSPDGRVLVVSSPSATQPGAKSGPYAIGKAAQEALILTLAQELEGSGATANIIQVKAIDTNHKRDEEGSSKYSGWTTPEEIAAAVLFLCSEQAKMINGTRLPMYG